MTCNFQTPGSQWVYNLQTYFLHHLKEKNLFYAITERYFDICLKDIYIFSIFWGKKAKFRPKSGKIRWLIFFSKWQPLFQNISLLLHRTQFSLENDVLIVKIHWIVFELQLFENSLYFPIYGGHFVFQDGRHGGKKFFFIIFKLTFNDLSNGPILDLPSPFLKKIIFETHVWP